MCEVSRYVTQPCIVVTNSLLDPTRVAGECPHGRPTNARSEPVKMALKWTDVTRYIQCLAARGAENGGALRLPMSVWTLVKAVNAGGEP